MGGLSRPGAPFLDVVAVGPGRPVVTKRVSESVNEYAHETITAVPENTRREESCSLTQFHFRRIHHFHSGHGGST